MGATNIQDAKVLISSTRVIDRTNGLKDLIHILKHNRGKPSLENLGNKAYLALCETLFQCMRDERSSWLRSRTKSAKTSVLLPLSATALRHIIISGVRAIKSSTVELIVDHIVDVLPGKGGALVKPLLEDLPKALRALLEYQPHVERLSRECWDAAVDFCIESLSSLFTEPDLGPPNSWTSTGLSSSRGRTPSESADTALKPGARTKSIPDDLVHTAEDFVNCIQFLTRSSNAPVLEKAGQILSTLVQFLERKIGRGYSAAFVAINSILVRTTLHSTDLTKSTIRDLLPIMKSMWADPFLRDEILITLMRTEAHISSMLAETHEETTSSELEALIETIYGDYRRRQESSALQYLEDHHLCFRHIGKACNDTHPLNTYAFSMGPGNSRCEGLWTTVSAIAHFSFILDERKRKISQEREDREEILIKRLRITHHFQEYLRHIYEPRSSAKRAALQVVAFMAQEGPLDTEDLKQMLEKLTVYIADENPAHSTWAMIGLAAAAFQKSASHVSLSPLWISAWQSASRVITSISSSRAACHLLNVLLRLEIVPYSAISDIAQSMLLSIELSGPALLTETSSSLLATIIQERTTENPTLFNQTAERILNWLFTKWTPSMFPERTYALLNAHHCDARDILRLLHSCLDRPFTPIDASPFMVLGPIAQAQIQTSQYKKLTHYLLLLDDQENFQVSVDLKRVLIDSTPSEHHPMQLETKLLEFCISELEKTRQRWRAWSKESPQGITSDMMRIITNFCIVVSAVGYLSDSDDRRTPSLESSVDSLTQSFVSFLSRRDIEQYKVDAVLEVCTRSLPDIRQVKTLSRVSFKEAGTFLLAVYLSKTLGDRTEMKESFYAEEDDFMDIDETPNSQPGGGVFNPDTEVPRHDVQAETDAAALRSSCSAYIHLIASLDDNLDDQLDVVPTGFVEHLVSVSEAELLRSRQFVRALFSTCFQFQRTSCLRLLERLSDGLIDPCAREFNTSEVANGMVVEVLVGTILVWSPKPNDREAQDLYENAEAMYAYYIKGMEKGGVRRSPNLQKAIANFLHGLLKHQPDFSQNRKSPSVRTSLFGLLSHGEITVKYHIAERLANIFEDFILSEHDKILQDVDDNLPGDDDWIEGIAIRLLVLARLASRWHTLLRQTVYRIFATAGSVERAASHAQRCIFEVARARDLADPQALFKLFAPQIIFTWLDRKRKFSEIPFQTFNYRKLDDLLRDVESEAVGQAIMLGLKEEVGYLAQQLGTISSDILMRNIGKAAAYTLSWDTCKGFARNKSDASNAMLLRDLVGPEQYSSLIQDHFPRVLGHILQTVDHEERFSKTLEKRPAFTATAKALTHMTTISHSSQELDLKIEPSFSAFYLIDQLERLCRRTGGDPVRFWTPSNFTFVMRMLLDRIHPALGSIHARSIIRKVRILIALAGEVAYEGYPLHMTLQSLRPFLTDIQCAEDTLGIVQYLFEHGARYLSSQLNFVTGIGLSILISIREFLGSSQESTTQQSQHTATMNKAQMFHAWFTTYLESLANTLASGGSNSAVKAFKSIITAASRVRTEGNSIKGSDESRLLLEILDDVRSDRRLLNKTSREVALGLLCQNFQPALTAREDVLGSDADVVDYAPQVWESCQRSNIGDGYLLWAARVLGRTFSACGEVKRSARLSRPWSGQSHSPRASLGKSSRAAIVKNIIDLFYSDDRKEVSLAEDGVRLLISRLSSDDTYVGELQKTVPVPIGTALNLPMPEEPEPRSVVHTETLEQSAYPSQPKSVSTWIQDLAISLCQVAAQDPILGSLSRILQGIEGMAELLFPYILHLVLLQDFDGERVVRGTMSEATMSWFSNCDSTTVSYVRILIEAILYLRSQPTPKEVTRVDRDRWVEVDYLKASQAATFCGMYRSALLFAETSSGQPIVKSTSRRSSILVGPPKLPVELQLSIYKNLDEPDSFYGVDRGSSLSSVLDRLDYEGDGVKSLLFRGARLDSQIRRSNAIESVDSRGMVKSLISLNMNSITHSLLSNDQFKDIGDDVVDSTLHTARKLGQWDIKAPEGNHTESSTLFKAFQSLHYASDALSARKSLNRQFLATMSYFSGRDSSSTSMKTPLRTLAVLTEADDIVTCTNPEHLLDIWDQMKGREKWMRAGEFDDVRLLLSCRETLFSVLSTNPSLLDSLCARTGTVRHMEVEALVSSSAICRKQGALQESLASVTYLSDIVQQCKSVGLDIEVAAQHEVASVLWEQGEAETSIRMRQHLIDNANFDSQATNISLPVLLAKLGHHLAEARLAKPDTIIKEYLEPAIHELKGQTQGTYPGQVFHEYALFCDKQLQSPEAAEDIARIKTVMDRKHQEWQDFLKLSQTDKSKSMRETYRRNAQRAQNWYNLDHGEYERLRKSREQFLRQCLENYLLSLQASDEYNNDALRVFSLWLEYSDMPLANEAVRAYLSRVPSGKFALLMNQLSSRLQAEATDFQKLLFELVFRICAEHPYHGMHQIFAIQMKVGSITREDVVRSKDESAKSRQRAAAQIAQMLGSDRKAGKYWNVIYQSNGLYHNLAMFKNEQDNRMGRDIALEKYGESKAMLQKIPPMGVPPATLAIEVRASCDYSDLPKIVGFKPRMTIANGLSAPKIITALASDGRPYKQLFKSGNDDLRQDAIMEQVFDQVSRLLKNHTATRIRNLGIRTYKVLPLSTRSGLMEFVPNTMPLHSYVMPAHEKYYPSDWRSEQCRKEIGKCQNDSLNTRVKIWQRAADNFHPVLRYFLLERFEDPDEWFERRLAYTRSTAAISILGHVLGLGDRHCHNILLDEKSGEVVHIDLGVSFEAGRVLPVPEVVPFRLTRDLVDAMGYTKTEGVFRRCCEFTMDTLREERESIMTLLNVLRYDPLVNWSVTPTKAKRMQEGPQETNAANGAGPSRAGSVMPGSTPGPAMAIGISGVIDDGGEQSNKKREEQAGEAGRALSVVEKKLSKTLSTRATVNELIQMATDERNLAVLYSGWASYA
ncbi:uncharacterized protein BDR25DRAFT_345757 [Lindgomyces ingoldianus]|uniref:Uncharacterized protein n=1 Tax=Lindgomyces ingoldianus TaxID=673940 RepID=A0ACB6QIN4_9PLEO|nr:uncharacterized protein BDR25DRAFT_345757 [Lindgomyces ingoldianus]KAF2466182.1 hypothetical protein BDR25DRAFT_345757 [Lindgomyces ingoldianus]